MIGGCILEVDGKAIGNHVIQNITHFIPVLNWWHFIKIQRYKIVLSDPAVAVTVGLIEPWVGKIPFLPIGIRLYSGLNLDIHFVAILPKIPQTGNVRCSTHFFWGETVRELGLARNSQYFTN